MFQNLLSNLDTKSIFLDESVNFGFEFKDAFIGTSYIEGVSKRVGLSTTNNIVKIANPTMIIIHGKNISHINPLMSFFKYLILFKSKACYIKFIIFTAKMNFKYTYRLCNSDLIKIEIIFLI